MGLPKFIREPNPEIFLSDNYLVWDLETTNKNKGDARVGDNTIVTVRAYDNLRGEHIQELNTVVGRLPTVDFVVAHGAKFEIKWLIRLGVDVSRLLFYDTLLGEYVLAGNRQWPLDLDSVSKRYGHSGKESVVSKMIKSGVCPSEIPSSLLGAYCLQDVLTTRDVLIEQRKKLKELGLLQVAFIRNISTPVLADIEMRGMFLDRDMVMDVHFESMKRYKELEVALAEITGGINMASPQQVAKFLYGELGFEELKDRRGNPLRGKPSKAFPEGNPKTDEDTISALKPKNKRQRDFLKLKVEESKLRKKISAYTNRFVEACENNACILYGSLNQSISQSHRLTSSNPNLQNIDRNLKKVVTSRNEGWNIRSGDYKQLEFRTAAVLAQDTQALADITSGHDVHAYTSKVLTEAGQPTNRQNAKAHTFKPLYGGTSGTKAEQTYYQAFKKKYPQITAMQERWVEEVLRTKQLRTVTGLIFYWPDCDYTSSGYIVHNEAVRNYPVQMFATADIAPTGVCLLWHEFKARELKSFIINEVHDSVIIEEAPEESEIVGNLLEKCLSKDVVGFFNKVVGFNINYPLDVEQKSSTHWDFNKPKGGK